MKDFFLVLNCVFGIHGHKIYNFIYVCIYINSYFRFVNIKHFQLQVHKHLRLQNGVIKVYFKFFCLCKSKKKHMCFIPYVSFSSSVIHCFFFIYVYMLVLLILHHSILVSHVFSIFFPSDSCFASSCSFSFSHIPSI
jgi:hypothetical protein